MDGGGIWKCAISIERNPPNHSRGLGPTIGRRGRKQRGVENYSIIRGAGKKILWGGRLILKLGGRERGGLKPETKVK